MKEVFVELPGGYNGSVTYMCKYILVGLLQCVEVLKKIFVFDYQSITNSWNDYGVASSLNQNQMYIKFTKHRHTKNANK